MVPERTLTARMPQTAPGTVNQADMPERDGPRCFDPGARHVAVIGGSADPAAPTPTASPTRAAGRRRRTALRLRIAAPAAAAEAGAACSRRALIPGS